MDSKKYLRNSKKKENNNSILKLLNKIDKKYHIPIILIIYFVLISCYIIFDKDNKNNKTEFVDKNNTKESFIATKILDKNNTKKEDNISIFVNNTKFNKEKNSTIKKNTSITTDKNSSDTDNNLTTEKNIYDFFINDQNISKKDGYLTPINPIKSNLLNFSNTTQKSNLDINITNIEQNLSSLTHKNHQIFDKNTTKEKIILDTNKIKKDQNLTKDSTSIDINLEQNKTEEIEIDYKSIKLIDIFPDRYSILISKYAKNIDINNTNNYEDQTDEYYYSEGEILYIDDEVEEYDENEEDETTNKAMPDEILDNSLKLEIQTTNSEISIKDLEVKFKKTKSDDIATLIAQRYYLSKDYQNSQKWALVANEINSDNQDSWEIFAKSKYKLGHKQDALKALKFYNEQARSQEIEMLIQDIEEDLVKN